MRRLRTGRSRLGSVGARRAWAKRGILGAVDRPDLGVFFVVQDCADQGVFVHVGRGHAESAGRNQRPKSGSQLSYFVMVAWLS